jgi:hypothetical protein
MIATKNYIEDIDGNIIGCCNCGAAATWDSWEERFIFSCPCGEIDIALLPPEFEYLLP